MSLLTRGEAARGKGIVFSLPVKKIYPSSLKVYKMEIYIAF